MDFNRRFASKILARSLYTKESSLFLCIVVLMRIFYDNSVMFYYMFVLKSSVQINSNVIVNYICISLI